MRSSTRSSARRFAVIALTFGLIGAAQATDTHQLSAVSAPAQNQQQATAAETRTDWNIDYPSQLGPEGPRATTLTESHKDTSLAQQAAGR